jgi:hypothetical protein
MLKRNHKVSILRDSKDENDFFRANARDCESFSSTSPTQARPNLFDMATDIPFSNMMLDNEVEKEVRTHKLKTAEKIHSILEKIKEFEKNSSSLVPIQNIVIGIQCLLI